MTNNRHKEEVLLCAKRCYNDELVAGTSGNLSCYDRVNKWMYITASGLPYNEMTLEDIVIIDLEGNIIDGIHKPSSEWRMHAEVYRNKPEISGIIHTHSPYATAFAVAHEDIPFILFESLPNLGSKISVVPFTMPGTEAVGKSALSALKESNACLLGNHGALIVGETISQAYIRAVYLEDIAKVYYFAKNIGSVKCIPDSAIVEFNRRKSLKK